MIAVRYLGGMGQRSFDGIRIGAGAIPAHHVNFLVTLQPGQDGISRAIWQEIERAPCFQVDQDGSVAVSAPEWSGKGNDVTAIPSPKNPTGRFRAWIVTCFTPMELSNWHMSRVQMG